VQDEGLILIPTVNMKKKKVKILFHLEMFIVKFGMFLNQVWVT